MIRKPLFLLLCYIFILHAGIQAQPGKPIPLPSTMLWRISGKGLQQPSYLFGTIHLQRKELFFFGDSVYHALTTAQGFAMEINPEGIMEEMMKLAMNSDDDEDKNDQPLSKQARKRSRFEPRYDFEPRPDDVSTIVDLYLYEQARAGGKWLGGLEDIYEHIGYVFDETGSAVDEKKQATRAERKLADSIIKWYAAQQLDKIHRTFERNKEYDGEMIMRNHKMTRVADSLAQVRSMFFAVGTAHLPGEEGMISLLQRQGYEVTPVFSSKKIPPMPLKIDTLKWVDVQSPDSGCTYRMPYKPKGITSEPLPFEVNVSFSLADMVAYIFFPIPLPAQAATMKQEEFIDRLVASYKKDGLNLDDMKKGAFQGFPTVMAKFTGVNEVAVQIRLVQTPTIIYMQLVSCQHPNGLAGEGVSHFFNSLRLNTTAQAPPPAKITTYAYNEHGFAISCPCTLNLKKSAKDGDGTRTIYASAAQDAQTADRFYISSVMKMNQGYYQSSDTAYFTAQHGEYGLKFPNATGKAMRRHSVEGYPAADYSFTVDDVVYTIRVIIRGNIIYTVGLLKKKDTPGNNDYFSSFRLTSFKEPGWSARALPGSSLLLYVPGPLTRITDTGDMVNPENEVNHYAYDQYSGNTYFIFGMPYSKYRWFGSDSAWMTEIMNTYSTVVEKDSLVEKKFYREAGTPVLELINTEGMANSYRHSKIFVNGDTLYEMRTYVTHQDYLLPAHRRFFDSISRQSASPNTVFTNKMLLLMQHLASGDSAKYAAATGALSENEFGPADMPLLHGALLQQYPRTGAGESNNTKQALIRAVARWADSSTVNFIRDHYHRVTDSSFINRDDLLYILARGRTREARLLAKDLLINHTPKKQGQFGLSWAFGDSLQLNALMFPEMTRLLSDSIYASTTMYLLDELHDSGMISRQLIMDSEKAICNMGSLMAKRFLTGNEYTTHYDSPINLLVKLNTPPAQAVLKEWSGIKNDDVLYTLFSAFVNEQLPLTSLLMQNVAASDYCRADAYRKLKDLGKQKQFPAAYATQEAMGRSLLNSYLLNEYDWQADKIQFLKEIIKPWKGKPHRFLVYKILLEDAENPGWYTGFSGPYTMDKKNVLPVADYSTEFVDMNDKISQQVIQKKFKLYFEELETEN